MKRFVCLAAVLALLTGSVRADEQADAKKLIEKSLKATGGEEKLAKIKAFTFKMKGKFYGMGEGIDYTGEIAVQTPDKSRIKIDGEIDGKPVTFFIQVSNGKKAWRRTGETTEEITDKDKLHEIQEDMHSDRVASLYPLLKDKEYKLAPLGEVKVDGKPAVGIRVSHKGFRDVNLFFDKDNAMLVKLDRTVKDEATDKEVSEEKLYLDYKEIDGVKQSLKMVINREGKKYLDAVISDFEVKDKLDDATFAKPEK